MKLSDENDIDARLSLWNSICHAVDVLSGKCSVFTSAKPDENYKITNSSVLPDVKTWQLMEAICLLAVLLKADKIWNDKICNIFGKTGPIHITEEQEDRYLWAQASLSGKISFLGGRSDLLVTLSSHTPSPSNILRIIECKSGKNIGAQVVRAEFGKAYDLRATSYLIWSFITPSESAVRGAKELGLDIEALGFDTDMRETLIKNPEILVYRVANTMEESRKASRMFKVLNSSVQHMSTKLLSA